MGLVEGWRRGLEATGAKAALDKMPRMQPRPPLPIQFRDIRLSDRPWVISSWIRSLGSQRPWLDTERNWYTSAQHSLVEKLLRSKQVECRVAHPPKDRDFIVGYCVGEPAWRVLHWIYVRDRGDFRRAQVGTRLLEDMFGIAPETIQASVSTAALRHRAKAWHIQVNTYALHEAVRRAER